jgi:predicted nucleic acid-binding protein
VVIDLDRLDPDRLPEELAVSALTLAELAAGPHAAADTAERARRQDRCSARRFSSIHCRSTPSRLVHMDSSMSRPPDAGSPDPRTVDLLIAATALACRLPLYTRRTDDFRFLRGLVDVIEV